MPEFPAHRNAVSGAGAVLVHRHIGTANAGINILNENIVRACFGDWHFCDCDFSFAQIPRGFHLPNPRCQRDQGKQDDNTAQPNDDSQNQLIPHHGEAHSHAQGERADDSNYHG